MNKTKAVQIKKYGGEAGYRAEMQRRRAMRKDYTTSGFAHYKTTGQTDKIEAARLKGLKTRRKKAL